VPNHRVFRKVQIHRPTIWLNEKLKRDATQQLPDSRQALALHIRQTGCSHKRLIEGYVTMSSALHDPRVPIPFNRRRLTVATLGISDAAIARAYVNPKNVRESTLLRLQKAAKELGLPAPGEAQR